MNIGSVDDGRYSECDVGVQLHTHVRDGVKLLSKLHTFNEFIVIELGGVDVYFRNIEHALDHVRTAYELLMLYVSEEDDEV